MANREINKIPVNKERFMKVLEEKGISIRELGRTKDIRRTEKTIRRYLDDGLMSSDLLNTIAKYLNVSSYYLSGLLLEDGDRYVSLISVDNGVPTIIEYQGIRYVISGRAN